VVVKIPKNDKHKEYARYAVHCLQMVTAAKDQETRSYSTRNGGGMAETGGCHSTSANPDEIKAAKTWRPLSFQTMSAAC
jgi:hypothetical protein